MNEQNLSVDHEYRTLVQQAKNIIDRADLSRNDKLQKITELLAEQVDVFDWVGFYLVDPGADRELVLGPYVGEETDHTRIPFGAGICGQAAESHETFVVQDVSEADNYLSCSIHVKSEVVIPIMNDDIFVAELDIDSHTKNAITDEHQEMLEEICNIIAPLFS